MIRVYAGRLGSGKTLSMVADALEDFRGSYRQVYTCMKSLRFPGAVYFDIEQIDKLCDLEQGIILLDEGQLAMGSRNWQRTPEAAFSALAQLRKNGLDLYLTTQHYDRLDTQLREKVNELVHVRRAPWGVSQIVTDPRLVDAKERRKPIRTKFMKKIDRRVYWLYDTYEILGTKLGGRLGRAEWLAGIRDRRKPRRGDGRLLKPDWNGHVFEYRENQTYIRKDAEEARRWLVETGSLNPSHPGWAAIVRKELERRDWLRTFGLEGREVPLDVTYDHPWADGCCPCCKDGVRILHYGVVPDRKTENAQEVENVKNRRKDIKV